MAAQIIYGLFNTTLPNENRLGVPCKIVLELASLTVPPVPVLSETSGISCHGYQNQVGGFQ